MFFLYISIKTSENIQLKKLILKNLSPFEKYFIWKFEQKYPKNQEIF